MGEKIPLGDMEGDPDLKFGAVDDRGQEQGSVTFIGDFERCEDTDAPKPFTHGKSYGSGPLCVNVARWSCSAS